MKIKVRKLEGDGNEVGDSDAKKTDRSASKPNLDQIPEDEISEKDEEKTPPRKSRNNSKRESADSSTLPPSLERIDEELAGGDHSASKVKKALTSNELAEAMNYVTLSTFVSFTLRELNMNRSIDRERLYELL